jgi:catechol 2,3-dioxygenase-like lactoylglutathione lyase family enzyme
MAADQDHIRGLHHVTAIASGAQRNIDFYTRVLGLRLVKRTVNFDSPETYHFYYGDAGGAPGSLLTFFPFQDAGAGRFGTGMAESIAFAVPQAALEQWMYRLAEHGCESEGPVDRLGARALVLRDPDGLRIELVAELASNGAEARSSGPEGGVPGEGAIRGLHSVALCVEAPGPTEQLLTATFGYEAIGEKAGRRRFRARGGGPAGIVDLVRQPERMRGRMGAGSVHHIAFRARDAAEQLRWREAILAQGLDVTPVRDRQYFRSIYFREPGGVLFEIATDAPGFTIDEPYEALGTALKLPPWLEPRRAELEQRLPPVRRTG